jgi:hypothetical protein
LLTQTGLLRLTDQFCFSLRLQLLKLFPALLKLHLQSRLSSRAGRLQRLTSSNLAAAAAAA